MRKLTYGLCLSAALLLSAVGCKTLGITESWSDSTRKTVHSAVLVVDKFLVFEMQNRKTVGPDVTAAADNLRVVVPPLVVGIRGSLDAYDVLASPAIQSAVNADVAKLQTYSAQAATLTK